MEIGFGSGGNVPHCTAAMRGVAAVEPSDLTWRLAGFTVASAGVFYDEGLKPFVALCLGTAVRA